MTLSGECDLQLVDSDLDYNPDSDSQYQSVLQMTEQKFKKLLLAINLPP